MNLLLSVQSVSWEELSHGFSALRKTLSSAASAANVTFFYLTAGILPPSGLLPDTTPEKHGKLME